MRCAVGLSTARNSETALEEVLNRLGTRADDDGDDIALVFTSIHHADHLDKIASALLGRGLGRHVIGCTGESIVGEDKEIEGGSALSILTAKLPGVTVTPLELASGNEATLPLFEDQPERTLLMLADPFSFPAERWFKELGSKKSKLQIVGGMASGSQTPGNNRLVLDGKVLESGAVGLLLDGAARIRTVVSQGCRPIGHTMIVTKAEGNIIRELGRRPAVEVLRELFEELTPEDRDRVQNGLHIGRVINEYQDSFGRGDFLVRNVMGVDAAGGVAVTDLVKVGQTVQFHVRDAETAHEDLATMLESASLSSPENRPAGALLFSCNGRGSRLFDEPNHDVAEIHRAFGPIPVAGFFAMGEVGPVGGQNFIHGFTASTVLFYPEPT